MLPPLAHNPSINDSDSGVGRGRRSDSSFLLENNFVGRCRFGAIEHARPLVLNRGVRIGPRLGAGNVAALHQIEYAAVMRPFDVLRTTEQLFKLAAGSDQRFQIDRRLVAANAIERDSSESAHDRRHGAGHELVGGTGDAFDQRMARATQVAGKQYTRIIGLDHALDDDIGLAVIAAVGRDTCIAE